MPSIFDRPEYRSHKLVWWQRAREIARRRSYYDGSVYDATMANVHGPLRALLQQNIRPLYLPMAEAVDMDVGIVPAAWSWPKPDDAEGTTQGQIDDWAAARRQVFDWSRWSVNGCLYVQYGAETGLSMLRVVDDRLGGRVLLAPEDPAAVYLVAAGQYDPTPALAFVVKSRRQGDTVVEYAEVITTDAIRTYVDGEPAGVDGRDAEYENDLGFVPFVEIQHKRTGRAYGEATYQHTIPMLDEVNAIASDLAQNIKDHGDPQWVVTGAEASDLPKSGTNVWFLRDPAADAKPVVAQLAIGDALAFLDAMAANMRASLPELGFRDLLAKDNIATATVELQLKPLITKILRVRPNYDQGLIDALRMAGRAGASMSLPDLAVLDDPALALDANRPVLPLNRAEQIDIELAEISLAMQREISEGGVLTCDAS